MASTDDVTQLLGDKSNLLVFLPVANFIYLSQHSNSNIIICTGVLTAFVASVVYAGAEGLVDITGRQRKILILLLFVWLILLIISVLLMSNNFNTEEYIPEVLFFTSAMIIFLVLADIVLSLALKDDYRGVFQDF